MKTMIGRTYFITYQNEVYMIYGENKDDAIKNFREYFNKTYGVKPHKISLEVNETF